MHGIVRWTKNAYRRAMHGIVRWTKNAYRRAMHGIVRWTKNAYRRAMHGIALYTHTRKLEGYTNMANRNLAITSIENGSHSGVKRTIQKAITTEQAWAEFWAEHGSTVFPTPKLPEVDFAAEMVLALYLGERSSGGDTCSIVKVEEKAREIVVTYDTTSSHGMGSCGFSQPYHLVKVSTSKKKVSFVKQVKTPTYE